MKISRILHAGYVFECGDTRIAFDPIFENPFSVNCQAYPNVRFNRDEIKSLKFDAVFISHYHDDHCSMESLNLLERETPIYMFCVFEEMFELIRALGFQKVFSLTLDVPVRIGSLTVIPRKALDADVDSLFQIQGAGLNVLNVVDSWIDYETLDLLKRQGPWDLVMWPFQTMREIDVLSPHRAAVASLEVPPEWIEQIQDLNPRYIVPSSCQFIHETWSWFRSFYFPISYQRFANQVRQVLPRSEVIRMNPSTSWNLTKEELKRAAPLSWVHPIGSQDVDYEFNPSVQIPSTAEIAKHFPALTSEQAQDVLKYCQVDLLSRYRTLDFSEGSYFEKPRNWKLILYDHTGVAKEFKYQVQSSHIECVEDFQGPVSWLSEISMTKMYAALTEGESMSSMYIRINDMEFDPRVEEEIKRADVLEDPLIHCLFDGYFASYQKAQLRRLSADRTNS